MSETSKSYGVNDGTTCPSESVAVNDVHALLHPEPSLIEWTASIMLPVYPHCKGGGEVNINAAFNTTPPKIDICLYLDKKGQPTVKLYFCPRAYPPNIFNNSGSISGEGAETLKELHAVINSAAIDASSEVAIGTSVLIQGKFQRVYLCKVCNSNNGRVRNGDNEEEEEREAPITNRNFRETNLVNNKNGKGRRKVGRGAPGLFRRQNKTSKAIKCPFRFKLMVDEFGFYISVSHGSGCPCHHGHIKVDPRFAPTPMRSLTKEEKVDANITVKATVNKRRAGVTYRDSLMPMFNHATDLLQQSCDERLAKKLEGALQDIISGCLKKQKSDSAATTSAAQKSVRWKGSTAQPHEMEMKDDTSTSPMSQASGSNMMKHIVVSITDGYQY